MTKNYLFVLLISCCCFIPGWGQNCTTPTTLMVSQITGTSAALSWNSSGDATQWDILLLLATDPEPTSTAVPSILGSVNPFLITGLVPCTSYKCYVRSVCAPSETSAWTQARYFTTMGMPSCAFSVNIIQSSDVPVSSLFAEVIGGTGPFSFQWSLNGVPISGATGQTYFTQGQSGQYQVTVTDSTNATITTTVFVQGLSINANNDNITLYPNGTNITPSGTSLLSNDFLNNLPINTTTTGNTNSYTNVVITSANIPSGFSINPNGTLNILPGTPQGTYTFTYQICAVQSPNSCSTATATITVANEGFLLNAFIDSNNNGVQDNGEVNSNLGNFQYQLNSGTATTAASSNGTYYIQESNSANVYTFSYSLNPTYSSYYSVTPSSYSNISFVAGSGVTVYNFPITQLPYADALIGVTQSGAPPRPGFQYSNRVAYHNAGNQAIASGTITFTKDNRVSITSVSQSGTVSNANGFTYDFTNLQPHETRSFIVTMLVPTIPTVNLNDVLTNTAAFSNLSADVVASNNTSTLSQIVVGSYDPNDKAESHGGKIVHATFSSNDYLTYTIQFENTGTYYAENVRINDVLDAKLDETSIKMVDASHPYLLNRSGNNVNWNFNGIDLLPAGKGHVTFQIKPKAGYAIGDIIPNTASIYFDFNPAIVTNTTQTEFVATMSVSEFNDAAFTVYPNPTKGVLSIASKNAAPIESVTLHDVLGKTVMKQNFATTQTTLDVSHLTSGIYFLSVEANNQKNTVKIVKQ
ncbi:T9SS type A sorting domain-containing protein [Flavobacterium enshiense]|uniref:DUF7619 domain-containing protein n=1 Tax=Flavobacterium enshiense TaxID=1341165 RepID=UPI00345D4866